MMGSGHGLSRSMASLPPTLFITPSFLLKIPSSFHLRRNDQHHYTQQVLTQRFFSRPISTLQLYHEAT